MNEDVSGASEKTRKTDTLESYFVPFLFNDHVKGYRQALTGAMYVIGASLWCYTSYGVHEALKGQMKWEEVTHVLPMIIISFFVYVLLAAYPSRHIKSESCNPGTLPSFFTKYGMQEAYEEQVKDYYTRMFETIKHTLICGAALFTTLIGVELMVMATDPSTGGFSSFFAAMQEAKAQNHILPAGGLSSTTFMWAELILYIIALSIWLFVQSEWKDDAHRRMRMAFNRAMYDYTAERESHVVPNAFKESEWFEYPDGSQAELSWEGEPGDRSYTLRFGSTDSSNSRANEDDVYEEKSSKIGQYQLLRAVTQLPDLRVEEDFFYLLDAGGDVETLPYITEQDTACDAKIAFKWLASVFIDKVDYPGVELRFSVYKKPEPHETGVNANFPPANRSVKYAARMSIYDFSALKKELENRGIPIYGKGKAEYMKEEVLWAR